MAIALRAMARLRAGRVADVEADLRGLIEWVAELQLPLRAYRAALPSVIAPLTDALVERGALEEAGSWPAVAGLERDHPEEFGFTFLLDSLARLRLAQGRIPDALRFAKQADDRQRAWGFANPGFIATPTTLAAALAASGRASEALDLCEEQLDRARHFRAAREEGLALRLRQEITGQDAGAVEVLARSEARLEYAKALVARGGRDALREALEIAERCGATGTAAHARRKLVEAGAKPRRAALTGVTALTAAQLRVARLAAAGRSNREIAEALYLTEKTVEGHLGNAYKKLGITSRAQLSLHVAGE
jgi:DNA-binding CsgD family transcriptional regulator